MQAELEDVKEEEASEKKEIPLLVLSNNPTEFKVRTLELLYLSAAHGQLAYLDAKHPESGEVIPMLVGLQPMANGKVAIFPLATLVTKDDTTIEYLIPDGTGGYSSVPTGTPISLDITIGSSEEEGGETEGYDKAKLN